MATAKAIKRFLPFRPFFVVASILASTKCTVYAELAKATARTASSATTTCSLSYDGVVSPDLVVIHQAREEREDDGSDGVPQSLAEDLIDRIADGIAKLYLETSSQSVATEELRQAPQRHCYGRQGYGGRRGLSSSLAMTGRFCTVDYAEKGLDLHITAHFFGEVSSASATVGEGDAAMDAKTVAARIDATVTSDTEDISREVLVLAVPKINDVIQYESRYGPVWSVRSRPSALEMAKAWDMESSEHPTTDRGDGSRVQRRSVKDKPSSLETLVLNNYRVKNRTRIDSTNIKTKKERNKDHGREQAMHSIELWEYLEEGTSTPTRALFLDSILRSITTVSGLAHAEAFVHPAVLAQTKPERVAVLSAAPLPIIRELMKHASVEHVTVVGADMDALAMVRKHMPQFDDCRGFRGVAQRCTENDFVHFVEGGVEEWLDSVILSERPPFKVVLVDVPPQSSSGGGEHEYLLSIPFHLKLQKILDVDSILVMNAGSAPSMDRDYSAFGSEFEARDNFLRQAAKDPDVSGLEYFMTTVYDEPMAAPLDTSFIVTFFADNRTFCRFGRKIAASIDLDIASRFVPSAKSPPDMPTVIYDGPTHSGYMTPSRAWERWYCHTSPGKNLPVCQHFLRDWFDSSRHHYKTEVRRDPIKGRALYAAEDIPAGHFVLADDAVMSLRLDQQQWDGLTKFVEDFPDALMYKQLRDFFVAYGFEAEVMGSTGWAVSIASNNTFTNHACTAEERNVGYIESAYEGEDSEDVSFSPVLARRAEIFSILSTALRDIHAGEEIMCDYLTFRTYGGEGNPEFDAFLSRVCRQEDGLVPVGTPEDDDDDEQDETTESRGEL